MNLSPVRVHIIPELGRFPLTALQPSHIQAYYSRMLGCGRRDGKGGLSAQGHSSVAITLDTYSHVLPGIQAAAAQRFDEGLQRTREEASARKVG